MTDNSKGRVVERHEVRAICEAGGEVTDGDGDVWCEVDGELAVRTSYETRPSIPFDCDGPFVVTKEPPVKSEIAELFTKLDASLTPATESPWRRGVPEKSGTYWWRNANDSGLCHVRIPAWSPDGATALRVGSTVPFDNADWFESTEFAPLREMAPE